MFKPASRRGLGRPRRARCLRNSIARNSILRHQEALVSQLAGQPYLQHQLGRTLIPLLLPDTHDVPFAVTIEVIDAHAGRSTPPLTTAASPEAYELQHILSGSGSVVDQHGNAQPVSAGDSLLLRYGAATLHRSPHQHHHHTHPHHTHPHHSHGSSSSSDPLVALKVLIPSTLLSDHPSPHAASKSAASALVAAWGNTPAAPTLPHATAAALLSQASAAIRAPLSPSPRHLATHPAHTPHTPHSHPPSPGPTPSPSHSATNLPFILPLPLNTSSAPPVTVRAMADLLAFQLPNQTNRLALAFGPDEVGLRLSFGVEIFQIAHRTPPHIHTHAHELFFVLLGAGTAFCGNARFPVVQGDCVVFPPGSVHGIDNTSPEKLYCLQVMLPNEMFVEFVKSGKAVGRLSDEDLCNLIALGCSSL